MHRRNPQVTPSSSVVTSAKATQRRISTHCSSPLRTATTSGSLLIRSGKTTWSPGTCSAAGVGVYALEHADPVIGVEPRLTLHSDTLRAFPFTSVTPAGAWATAAVQIGRAHV